MRLEYQNLTLRTADATDARQLAIWWNDGTVMAHAGFPLGLSTTEEEIKASLMKDNLKTRQRFIIEYEDMAIGEMNYRMVDVGIAEIGIKICDFSMQNKGFGKLLLSMLIEYLFNEQKCQKIILDTNVKNIRAQHVYTQIGFVKCRTRIDCWRDQLGVLQSAIDYELLPQDFNNYLKKQTV